MGYVLDDDGYVAVVYCGTVTQSLAQVDEKHSDPRTVKLRQAHSPKSPDCEYARHQRRTAARERFSKLN